MPVMPQLLSLSSASSPSSSSFFLGFFLGAGFGDAFFGEPLLGLGSFLALLPRLRLGVVAALRLPVVLPSAWQAPSVLEFPWLGSGLASTLPTGRARQLTLEGWSENAN